MMDFMKFFLFFNCLFDFDIDVWEEILAYYNDKINKNDIWKEARKFDDFPDFVSIYRNLAISKCIRHLCNELGIEPDSAMLDIKIDKNSVIINDKLIQSYKDWIYMRDYLEHQIGDPELLE